MGVLDNFLDRRLKKSTSQITKAVTEQVVAHVDGALAKSNEASPFYAPNMGAKRYTVGQDSLQSRKKPNTSVSFETLRRFSVAHEVSRACVNYRKRQITGLEWKIVSADDDDESIDQTAQRKVQDFFRNVGGHGVGYRKFIDSFVEDLMVLDAVAIEKQRTRGNQLFTLVPLDGATIRIIVDQDTGALPMPPDEAYAQVIRGVVTEKFTTDELIYGLLNNRSDTPYGLAPLESLIVIVTSSLKTGMYNLGYLTDGNVPEGLFTMPEDWTPQQIKDFQEHFDAMLAGDETKTSRMKFMPKGEYTSTKKRDDMAFTDFNDWLLKITCALFEVSPNEIGFSPKTGLGGKGFGEQQAESGENKGLLPLAQYIEEVFTKVIQEDLGYPNLKFDFPTLRQKDERKTAEVNEILIRSGQRTINEVRTDDGLSGIDGLDKPIFGGQFSYIDAEAQTQTIADANANDSKTGDKPDDSQKTDFATVIEVRSGQIDELKTFRKYAVKKHKDNKAIRPFVSKVLSLDMVEELNSKVTKAKSLEELRDCFIEPINELEMANVDTALKERNRILNVV